MRWYTLYNFVKVFVVRFIDEDVEKTQGQQSTKTGISAVELKRLLTNISSYKNNVCFRPRVLGEMWMKHHCKISYVNGNIVTLFDERDIKYYMIDINKIVQFDFDEKWQNFQPHFHYDVFPSPELQS
jgi:hypothetical protein